MELTVPMLSEQDRHVQRMNLRRYVREVVNLRMIAADKAGLASGQVIDITTRGCGLRLTKPLTRGQYLTLKVYPNDGTASVLCEVWCRCSGSKRTGQGSPSCGCRWRTSVGCTDSAAIGSYPSLGLDAHGTFSRCVCRERRGRHPLRFGHRDRCHECLARNMVHPRTPVGRVSSAILLPSGSKSSDTCAGTSGAYGCQRPYRETPRVRLFS